MDKEQLKLEITQDKLVDLLLHAATREDIAKSANENRAEIVKCADESKVAVAKLEASFKDALLELKRSNDALEARVDRQFLKISTEIENLKSSTDRQFLKIDQRYNWILGVIIATGVAVSGLMIGLTSFMF